MTAVGPRTELGHEVSKLYQEYPYPAHGIISTVIPKLLDQVVAQRSGDRYLDAGCGTGEQTLGVAKRFSELDVTGLDLNEASLAFARRLAQENSLSARFVRRSLMDPIEGLGPFDIVTSIGVLHSLPDPAQGFRMLRQIVHEDSWFLGMVYGSYGKWGLFQVRDALNMLADGLDRSERLSVLSESRMADNTGPLHYARVLVERLRFGPDIAPLEAARRVLKGRNEAYQADAYTHVQEETYTWSELIALLEETGWRFVGWPKRSGMPDAPEQLFRGRALELVRKKSLAEQATIYEKLVRPPNLYFLARPA